MKLRHVFYLLIGLVFLSQANRLNNADEKSLLYTIHTTNGDIQCNYHNSANLNNGWMKYYDHKTKEQKYIEYWKVDSITVHKEYWLMRGPRDKQMKYIDLRKDKH
jgi:hypothetical protein